MTDHHADKIFTGSIAQCYEMHLVPLIFEPYARDLAVRLAGEPVSRVLEVAAGTGVATRAMADALAPDVSIVATDLNQAMLDQAARTRADENVIWRQADALKLPFKDASFDAVVCQFGVMFFPDRARAYSEAVRVLKPEGRFLFSVWDRIGENEFADTVTESLAGLFPADPPRFLDRTPHGYWNVDEIAADLSTGGFRATPMVETVSARSKASSPAIPAIAYCQGTPLRNEIEARIGLSLEHATNTATAAVAERFGAAAVNGKIQGHIVTIRS